MELGKEVAEILTAAAARLGRTGLVDIETYAGSRAIHLAGIAGQPGFELAVVAERDNVAIRAGLALVDAADAADAELVGIIGGALSMAARIAARTGMR